MQAAHRIVAACLAVFLAIAGTAVMASPAAATWLQVCAADAGGGDVPSDTLALPDQAPLRVRAGPPLAACGNPGLPLPLPPSQVAAVRIAAASDRVDAARTILVYRPDRAAAPPFGPVETILPPATAAPPAAREPAPLRGNLLEQLQLRPYGVEERVHASVTDGRLSVQCGAGDKPAGLLLSAPWTMPQAALALAAVYQADGAFTLSLADDAASQAERAIALGELGARAGGGNAVLPLPPTGWQRDAWRHFALACPRGSASLSIASLRLEPQAAKASSLPARATWVWASKAWIGDPAGVLALARRHGMGILFITVPTQGAHVAQPARLAAFARRAAQAGVALWAVEGDPHMALPRHHAATADRVRAFAAYNRGVEAAARLHGVQFDIEHYLIDGYGMAAGLHDRHYAQLLAQLKAVADGMPLEFVAPFWWRGKTVLQDALAHAATTVTVMDYRTDEAQIRSFAAPWLDWGSRHQVGVRIALEAGPIAPERQHRYVRTDGPAELWAVTFMPEHSGLAAPLDVLLLLKQPYAGLPGAGFRHAGDRLLDGSATTFRRQPARLRALLPQLERDFSAWASFAGMAVHEPDNEPDNAPASAVTPAAAPPPPPAAR